MKSRPQPSRALTRYAWAFVIYMLAVILFGAWVRITHSGAGCGSHWPTCHGEIIPFEPSVETMIEYTHRLTSGLLGIFGLVLIGWSWRRFGNHGVFWGSVVTYTFIIFEGLIGAGIVLAELVADNDSVARAVVIAIHLVNTLTLVGAAGLTAWWSSGRSLPVLRVRTTMHWLLAIGLLLLVATSMSGAVTALGDTLFPVDPAAGPGLLERVRDDLSPANHFLVRLRIVHPVVAVVAIVFLFAVGRILHETSARRSDARRLALVLMVGTAAQFGIGLLNIALAAPGWLQLVHLLLAQVVWLATLLLLVSLEPKRE